MEAIPKPTILPIEIVQIVMDMLASELLDLTLEWTHQAWPAAQVEHDRHLATLQKTLYRCTLVSRAFSDLVIPLLYLTVHLFTPRSVAAFASSLKLRQANSTAQHITSLNIYSKERFYMHKPTSPHLTLSMLTEILVSHGTHLRHLNLQGWHNVRPFNLIAATCPNLLHLNLVAVGSAHHFDTANDFKSADLAHHCPNLMVLNLSWCGWIGFDQLTLISEFFYLRALNLSSCASLRNDELVIFLPLLPDLEELYLRGNRFIDLSTVESIIKSCKGIELFDLTGGFLKFHDNELDKLDEERPGCLVLPASRV